MARCATSSLATRCTTCATVCTLGAFSRGPAATQAAILEATYREGARAGKLQAFDCRHDCGFVNVMIVVNVMIAVGNLAHRLQCTCTAKFDHPFHALKSTQDAYYGGYALRASTYGLQSHNHKVNVTMQKNALAQGGPSWPSRPSRLACPQLCTDRTL